MNLILLWAKILKASDKTCRWTNFIPVLFSLINFGYLCNSKTDKIMTKAEIVNEISLKTGADRKETLQIVKGFMNSVKKLLANEEIYIYFLLSWLLLKVIILDKGVATFFFLTFIVGCEAYLMICKKTSSKIIHCQNCIPSDIRLWEGNVLQQSLGKWNQIPFNFHIKFLSLGQHSINGSRGLWERVSWKYYCLFPSF